MNKALVKDPEKQPSEHTEKKTKGTYRAIVGGTMFIAFGLAAATSLRECFHAMTIEALRIYLLISGGCSAVSFLCLMFAGSGIKIVKSLPFGSPMQADISHMERQRRSYLRKKIIANSLTVIGSAILVITVLFVLFYVYAVKYNLSLDEVGEGIIGVYFLLGVVFVIAGIIAFCCYLLIHYSRKKVQSLVRVPPVAEQIAALPAEAILVRGSEQPAAAPSELLRAAQAGKVDPAADLLRPNESIIL